MNRLFSLGLVVVGLMLASGAAWSETRIAAVNINKVLNQAPQTRDADSRLKDRFAGRQEALLKEQEALREMEEKYRKDRDVMSPEERDKMEAKLREKMRDFKRKSGEFTEDYAVARNQALGSLQEDVYKAIETVAEREHIDLVVGESVLYASDRIDITDKVLKELKLLMGNK